MSAKSRCTQRGSKTSTIEHRSAKDSIEWWTNRAEDCGLLHIVEILGELRSFSLLQKIGCHIDGADLVSTPLEPGDPLVAAEGEAAEEFGELAFSHASRRMRTMLAAYRGYPAVVAGLANEKPTVSEDLVKATLTSSPHLHYSPASTCKICVEFGPSWYRSFGCLV